MKTSVKAYFVLAALLIGASIGCFVPMGCATRVQLAPARPAVTNVDGTITPATKATYTNAPNKTVTKIAEVGHEVTPYVPSPWGKILDAGLLAALGIAGAIAKNQNTKKKDSESVAKTIITAVETVGSAATAIKEAIATKALEDGTADKVHAAVQSHTAPPDPVQAA